MAVNLRAAHQKNNSCAAHEALLACFLHRAAHELLLTCSARKIARVQHILRHKHVLNQVTTKIEEHTCVHHM